jgi:hypothetical protein
MIAGAKNIAATPSLRLETGCPLFAAAGAIIAVIFLPRKWVASNKRSMTS